jgi:hypothetical protein
MSKSIRSAYQLWSYTSSRLKGKQMSTQHIVWVLALFLGACGYQMPEMNQPTHVTYNPDGSSDRTTIVQQVNGVGEDIGVIITTHCVSDMGPCFNTRVADSTQRGLAGAIFEGAGAAATHAVGFAVGMNNRRPDQYNNTTAVTGANFGAGAVAGGAGGAAMQSQGSPSASATSPVYFQPGAVQGGSANNSLQATLTNQQRQQAAANARSSSTSSADPRVNAYGGSVQAPNPGPVQMNGHTWVPPGWVDP